jgi:hypothetical protein
VATYRLFARAKIELSRGPYIERLKRRQRTSKPACVEPLYVVVAGLRAPMHFFDVDALELAEVGADGGGSRHREASTSETREEAEAGQAKAEAKRLG